MTLNALHAANEVLLPTPTEFLAVCQLGELLARLKRAERLNPRLRILGVLPTLYVERTRHAQDAHAQLIQDYGSAYRLFDPIPRSVRFADSTLAGVPLITYAPKHPGALAYEKLAKEIDK